MPTVRLPASLRPDLKGELYLVDVRSIAELIEALDRHIPGFRAQFDQAGFNFAVNDELLLDRVLDRTLTNGDIVEIVPSIAGG